MESKIIRVTDKGQISLPIDFRKSAGISKGDNLFVVSFGGKIVIEKVKESDFSDLLKHSEFVSNKLWDNNEDEIWDTV